MIRNMSAREDTLTYKMKMSKKSNEYEEGIQIKRIKMLEKGFL